ncbi:MAG: hypothetical protein LAT84_12400 [Balneolia bacterium]|nr:hypothetical protein [Balneolia bacterium]
MKNIFSVAVLSAAFLTFTACSSNAESGNYSDNASYSTYASAHDHAITRDMIQAAQEGWIQELIRIGEAHTSGGDAEAVAREVLNAHYDYATNPVLFKPTLTHGEQTFRNTKEGALAYFVGGNADFPNDSGFALTGYVSGTTEIAEVFIHGDVAIAQGNITLVAPDDSTVMVDKTFGYRLDDEGHLRIVLHHSSLPFAP